MKLTAARRIKGVVRPQARPTRMKPRVKRRREGGEGGEGEDILGNGEGFCLGDLGDGVRLGGEVRLWAGRGLALRVVRVGLQ